jgi:hypothetical protein
MPAAFPSQVFAQQLPVPRIEQAHDLAIPLHLHLAVIAKIKHPHFRQRRS